MPSRPATLRTMVAGARHRAVRLGGRPAVPGEETMDRPFFVRRYSL
jgi:hypothetical protein